MLRSVLVLLLSNLAAAAQAGVLVSAVLGARRARVYVPGSESFESVLRSKFGVSGPLLYNGDPRPPQQLQHGQVIQLSTGAPRLTIVHPPEGFVTASSRVGLQLAVSGLGTPCSLQLFANKSKLSSFGCKNANLSFVLRGLPLGTHQLELVGHGISHSTSFQMVAHQPSSQRPWPLRCGVRWHQDSLSFAGSVTARPLVILLWDNTLTWWRYLEQPGCRVPVVVAEHLECPEEADVIVWGCWNKYVSPDAFAAKPAHQRWMYFCMEAAQTDGRMHQAEFREQFDVISTYELNSTLPRLYLPPDQHLLLKPPREKTQAAPVVWVASHCNRFNGKIHRDTFVKALGAFVTVDALGPCLNTRPFPKDFGVESGSSLIPIYARYRFTLAFHDATDVHYVDEKLYLPLIAGSVPIVSGPSNLAKFAPPNSYIDVDDFQDPASLAAHLKYLLQNESAYQEYLRWKHEPLPPRFVSLMKQSVYTGKDQYGEASHHGFPTPIGICGFSEFFRDLSQHQKS